MDLTHHLRVPAPLDEVWAVVTDPGRAAGVLPGTVVDSVADDTFTGTITLKLASSLLALAGSGRYVSRDDGARRAVVATTGTDRRGDAAVEATHTVSLARADGSTAETDVTVATTMSWSGRPSRLGDGVVADAVDRVLEHTSARIAARVAEGEGWAPAAGPAGRRGLDADAVLDHPVELGDDLGDLEDPADADGSDGTTVSGLGARPSPAPSPSPGPSPRPPRPAQAEQYVYRPYDNAAEPHLVAMRTFSDVVVRRLVPYAGLGALAAFVVVAAVRRARR